MWSLLNLRTKINPLAAEDVDYSEIHINKSSDLKGVFVKNLRLTSKNIWCEMIILLQSVVSIRRKT